MSFENVPVINLDGILGSEIPWGPSGELVFERTYARTKPDGSLETWPETARRVAEGNMALILPDKDAWTDETWAEVEEVYEHLLDFRLLPGGRHLWATGVPGRQHLQNCFFAGHGSKLSDHFGWQFMRQMEGGGVGANYSRDLVGDSALVSRKLNVHIVCDPSHPDYESMKAAGLLSEKFSDDWHGCYEIADSREGWSEALCDLLDTYQREDEVKYQDRVYDVSKVRHKGARLKSFGGTASGPAPLAEMLIETSRIVNRARGRLTAVELMEIDHHIARCTVAGGVRRSARMSLLHWLDEDIFTFIHCKADHMGHWTTNISVEVDEHFFEALYDNDHPNHGHAKRVFDETSEAMFKNGEPGFFNKALVNEGELEEIRGCNPCHSADTRLLTEDGWVTLGEAYLSGNDNRIIVDGRVTYEESSDGVEHPENWKVEVQGHESVTMDASPVFLTQVNADVVKVTLANGMEVGSTPDHHFATQRGMVEAQHLTEDDRVLITRGYLPSEALGEPVTIEEKLAVLTGLAIGDGTYYKQTSCRIYLYGEKRSFAGKVLGWASDVCEAFPELATTRSKVKATVRHDEQRASINSAHLGAILDEKLGLNRETKGEVPSDYVRFARSREARFFLAGLAFCDGTVNLAKNQQSIRINQSNEAFLRDVQLVALANGIYGGIYKRRDEGRRSMPDGKGGYKDYFCKANYELVFMSDAYEFARYVGFLGCAKDEKALMLTPSRKKSTLSKVVSVVPDGTEDVYCLKEDVRRIMCVNGLTARRCGEISLADWESCIIGHVNLQAFDADEDHDALLRAHELMTRFLMRATFAPVISKRQELVVQRNRRIGVGHFGMQGHLVRRGASIAGEAYAYAEGFNTKFALDLQNWYDRVRETAMDYAFELRIPEPIKVTTEAPTGSIAKLPGTSEGVHPIFSPYFERRIRFNPSNEDQNRQLQELWDQGYDIEADIYDPNMMVAVIPTKDTLVDIAAKTGAVIEGADEISTFHMFAWQALIQEHYADNAVSFTANLSEDATLDDLKDSLWAWLPRLKGTTVFPYNSRPQSPYTKISAEQYEAAKAKQVADSVDLDCSRGGCPIR